MKKALLLFLSLLALEIQAATPEERGLQIAREVDRRDTGFTNLTAEMKMELRNAAGDSSVRQIRLKILEVNGDGDKSLTVFDQPADVKGTAFLSYTHALKPDDQWLYLPALKRVKRIASANKSGPFMGSEFAYEDLTSQEVEKYRYKYLRDEVLDGRSAFVVERTPAYEHSGYTRQHVWIDRERFIPLKLEFFDRKEALLKTLTLHGYRQYLNQFWRADEMRMVNHQTGKGTVLTWKNYRFRAPLSERDFDQNSLQRVR